jgi:hypothetical protein
MAASRPENVLLTARRSASRLQSASCTPGRRPPLSVCPRCQPARLFAPSLQAQIRTPLLHPSLQHTLPAGAVLVYALGSWLLSARKWFDGPNTTGRPLERNASGAPKPPAPKVVV